MATQKKSIKNYKNRQKLQRDALQLAADMGWRTVYAKGDQLIIRR